jgi:3'-phosphoadenosine 5'-phosphosulfate synthase
VVTMVTEIPMFYTAKMELQKETKGNPISQDSNKDGSPRYFTYGTPFFNYGLIPQTWEDPDVKSDQGYGGDNDPLDIIELGSLPMAMGSVKSCRVLGSFELIDEGETDHKILCISLDDKDASRVRSLDDLERVKPGHLDRLRDWLKRYKTSDGKGENNLASETPRTASQAMTVIQETHTRWKALCGKDGGTNSFAISSHAENFWLASSGCRG